MPKLPEPPLAPAVPRFKSRVGSGFLSWPLDPMKTIRAFIIGIMVFVGIAGCSTPSSKVASGQRPVSTTAAAVEDARRLYEMGRLDDAQHKLQAILAIEPDNPKAQYYLALVHRSQELKPQPRGYYQTIPQQPGDQWPNPYQADRSTGKTPSCRKWILFRLTSSERSSPA